MGSAVELRLARRRLLEVRLRQILVVSFLEGGRPGPPAAGVATQTCLEGSNLRRGEEDARRPLLCPRPVAGPSYSSCPMAPAEPPSLSARSAGPCAVWRRGPGNWAACAALRCAAYCMLHAARLCLDAHCGVTDDHRCLPRTPSVFLPGAPPAEEGSDPVAPWLGAPSRSEDGSRGFFDGWVS